MRPDYTVVIFFHFQINFLYFWFTDKIDLHVELFHYHLIHFCCKQID